MSEQSAFNSSHLQEAPLLANPGLLDQLGLPPKFVRFVRKNQLAVWVVTGAIISLIAVVSLYGSYSSYREDQAASALTEAMKAEEAKKPELLQKVVVDYGSTSAGLWARIELAHLALAQGDTDKVIAELQELQKSLDKDNPLVPLVILQLAGLYEDKKNYEQAITLYTDLEKFKGFEARVYEAMGRIHELRNKKELALEMYQKYLAVGTVEGAPAGAPAAADPEREMIQARISALQE